jgi:hypothetical protein
VSTPEGRLVVDGGTSTYAEGSERDAVRGTGAHNTIRVDGADQFEVWKSFRVGRRADVYDVTTHSETDYGYVTGRHDGYRSLGIDHRRTIFNLQIGGWLVVDSLAGTGWHAVDSLLHLAPDVRPKISGSIAELQPTEWCVALIAMPAVSVLADLYSPRLGVRLASTTLAGRGYAELPLNWVYWIAPCPSTALDWDDAGDGLLCLSAPTGGLEINPLFIEAY